jgi:hypothetical protein
VDRVAPGRGPVVGPHLGDPVRPPHPSVDVG